MTPYPEATEQLMKRFFNTLSEKDRRRYAAVEAEKLGHGGISYIAGVLGCSRTTIHEGLAELEALPKAGGSERRLRQEGGGRKPYEATFAGIDEAFLDVLKDNIAGDPMDEQIRWTNLTHEEIKVRLAEQHALEVSETVIRKLLDKHNFRRRQAQKNER
jgi:hypothetical protein